jgi:hypothetical protein
VEGTKRMERLGPAGGPSTLRGLSHRHLTRTGCDTYPLPPDQVPHKPADGVPGTDRGQVPSRMTSGRTLGASYEHGFPGPATSSGWLHTRRPVRAARLHYAFADLDP